MSKVVKLPKNHKGSFNNYLDKGGGEGVSRMSTLGHVKKSIIVHSSGGGRQS